MFAWRLEEKLHEAKDLPEGARKLLNSYAQSLEIVCGVDGLHQGAVIEVFKVLIGEKNAPEEKE